MTLSKRCDPLEADAAFWEKEKIFQFDLNASGPVYSIDTPPPNAFGHLHLEEAAVDLRSITHAKIVEIVPELLPGLEHSEMNELSAAVETQTEIY
jgi:hypothetical protein